MTRMHSMSKIALDYNDQNILTLLSMILEAEGFSEETYDASTKKISNLAILDVSPPYIDRMNLLQKVRKKSDVPVIFLTSKNAVTDENL